MVKCFSVVKDIKLQDNHIEHILIYFCHVIVRRCHSAQFSSQCAL